MYRFIYLSVLFLTNVTFALTANPDSLWFAQHYYKQEFRIPMRDGKLLFTAVYIPKDTTETHPIRITRTPYTCAPYGENNFLVPQHLNLKYAKEYYIMVWQDVRGRFMSEGNFRDMTPYIPQKTDSSMVDESSDAFDTIEWLIKHIPYNNGKVGIWGSSYPGFYTIMAAIDAHPNLVAVVPQAPIADWFVGDDMHHNGAFTLQMAFNFFSVFGIPRDTLTTVWPSSFTAPSPDAYSFFLSLGAVKNANTRFFHHNIPIWEDLLTHGNYDEYWRKRQTLQHIKNIKPAMLLVGGWYDAEDFYGTINTYRAIRKNSKETHTNLIIGPWAHSTWNTVTGDRLGDFSFSSATAEYYRDSIEFIFFNQYLKNAKPTLTKKALLFDTGTNSWLSFDDEREMHNEHKTLYLADSGKIEMQPASLSGYAVFTSDPKKPVPYTAHSIDSRKFYPPSFMNEDQRFAFQRPDVISFTTDELKSSLTISGPLDIKLYVSTTGTDADWVVKIIDVYPDSATNPVANPNAAEFGGYQRLLRGEILRGKYRNSMEKPEPFIPEKITEVQLRLQDILHTFERGHKLMVQVQSSWFPLFDRNPQKFCDIYSCSDSDFSSQTHKVYFGQKHPSSITFTTIVRNN